jgi:hypothetical protein
VARRPLEREEVYLDGDNRTTQLMRDSVRVTLISDGARISQSATRSPVRRAHSHVRSAIVRQATCVLAVSLLVLASCETNPVVIASTNVSSPDGEWIATAHTDQYSGPGNAGFYEIVSLRRTAGIRDRTKILLLDVGESAPPIVIKMVWLTNSHLEIQYNEPATVDFSGRQECGS